MSQASVIPYFREVMTSLNHKEWKDAFSDDNIPSTIVDRSYHLLLGSGSAIKQNQEVIEINQPVSLKLYVKGYRDTADGRDRAITFMESIIKKALETDRRAAGTYASGIKNVLLLSSDLDELDVSNDNIIRVTLNFNCIVMLANS